MAQGWQEDVVVKKIKTAILARGGPQAFKSAVRSFRVMDINDDHTLSKEEFNNGLNNIVDAKLSKQELNYLFTVFDKNKDGSVGLNEFVNELIGGLNPRRKKVVDRAYKKFDATGDGVVTIDDLKGTFKAANNPLVLRGEKTEEEVMMDFLATFEGPDSTDGRVTKEEFYAYYAGLSASCPHDDYFEALVIKAWDLDDAKKPRLDETSRDWGEGGDPLSTKSDVRSDMYASHLSSTQRTYNADHMKRKEQPFTPNPSVKPDYITTAMRDYPPYDADTIKKSDPTRANEPPVFSPTGNKTIDMVRKKILDRAGDDGFVGLQRTFRIMDKNRNNQLSWDEIQNGLKRYGVPLTKVEMDALMKFLDKDGTGIIDTTEFYRQVRGPITQKSRLNILRVAFDRLDKDSSGVIAFEEMAMKYDASNHPKVKAGKKTENEIRREFIADWDKDGDSNITWEEWLEYYANISCSIDNDQYFELMIRNAWHISGGVGAAANTSNRRVLVIYNDDSQKVVEIKDDLGIRKDDIAAMKKKLEAQGHTNIKKIQLTM